MSSSKLIAAISDTECESCMNTVIRRRKDQSRAERTAMWLKTIAAHRENRAQEATMHAERAGRLAWTPLQRKLYIFASSDFTSEDSFGATYWGAETKSPQRIQGGELFPILVEDSELCLYPG